MLRISRVLFPGFAVANSTNWVLETIRKRFLIVLEVRSQKSADCQVPVHSQGTREESWPAPVSEATGNLWHPVACGSSLWSQLHHLPFFLACLFSSVYSTTLLKINFLRISYLNIVFPSFPPLPVYFSTPSVSACLLLLKLITFSSIMIITHTYTRVCKYHLLTPFSAAHVHVCLGLTTWDWITLGGCSSLEKTESLSFHHH